MTRCLLELVPGTRSVVRVGAGPIDELASLEQAATEAGWSRVEELGHRCLGLGLAVRRALVDEVNAARRLAGDLGLAGAEVASLLIELAESNDAKASFTGVRDELGDRPDLLGLVQESLALLEQGVTQGVPLLAALTEGRSQRTLAAAAIHDTISTQSVTQARGLEAGLAVLAATGRPTG